MGIIPSISVRGEGDGVAFGKGSLEGDGASLRRMGVQLVSKTIKKIQMVRIRQGRHKLR